ncbi:MAG: restriction endonuclease subunit [Achromobacter mucicolens]|jgi:type I restriction enzyme S subunit|uniref:restriction endonuclease subunit S n=1 Tax=Achromobacter mucicolens TaxID=1389922 RepID=UPI0024331D90|nr:restriction endonuclease subunit S [Achromobacter mucicolens]MDF2862281.1 restriction endonuclease subunit [Achromobacter mucicolens]
MSLQPYGEYASSGVAWLGETPRHWRLSRLKFVLEGMGSGGTPDTDNASYWATDDSGTPWVAIGDLSDREYVEVTAKKLTTDGISSKGLTVWPPGTLLFSMYASLGHTAELTIAAATNQAILALLPVKHVHQKFLTRWLEFLKPTLKVQASSNTQDNLNAEKVKNLLILLPPPSEQTAIATFLDRETAKIDALIAEQEKLIALLAEKRQATISHVVTKGLDPHAPMKDSGVVWLGEVPAHWKVLRIKHLVASIEQGWSPQCENFPVDSPDEWGVMKVGCVNGGTFRPEQNKKLPQELEPIPAYSLKCGDLLISRANTRELVGSAAVVEENFDTLMLCDKLYRLKLVNGLCDPAHLAAYLGTPQARSQIELEATGASSSMLNIGQSVILDLPALVPCVEEQRAIQQFLRAESERLDSLNASVKRTVDLLKERRSALITAAVTGQIDVRKA